MLEVVEVAKFIAQKRSNGSMLEVTQFIAHKKSSKVRNNKVLEVSETILTGIPKSLMASKINRYHSFLVLLKCLGFSLLTITKTALIVMEGEITMINN